MASLSRPIPSARSPLRIAILAAFAVFSLLVGCKKTNEVDDPQLKPIQEMLNRALPQGSTQGAVQQFLSTRGYPTEPTGQPGTLVTIIRHIDTERLQPVTARVTFYFDANGKLNTTEIVRTFNQPIPK